MGKIQAVAGLVCALCLSACIPALPKGPARLPNTHVPSSYAVGSTSSASAAESATAAESASAAQLKWSEFFTDRKLDALIEEALKNNQELQIVALELDIAQNEVMARKGDFLPKLSFRTGVGIDKVGQYTSQGASDDANKVAQNLPNFALGFSASWEIDVWSKLRNATKAATVRYLATQEGRNLAITMLVAEIASSYYELMALDAQLDVVNQNIEIQQRALTVVKLQKEAAKVTELAVQRFEAEVLKNQSRQFAIQQQRIETENHLNFLLGRFPQHVDRSAQPFVDLVPQVVHAGIPSQLLDNRPDVKQAALQVMASELDVKVAKASFYPVIGISANIGIQSFDVLKLVSMPASLVYGLAADLMTPLLNRKALTATYFTANAKQMQAVYQYERAILSGYVEVVKLLSMIHNLEQSYDLQAAQVDKLKKSIEISSRLFVSARADYMEVLLTRRDALEAQMELIENKKRQMIAAVGLYRALGGGWR